MSRPILTYQDATRRLSMQSSRDNRYYYHLKVLKLTHNMPMDYWREIRDESYWEEHDKIKDPFMRTKFIAEKVERFLRNIGEL